MELSVQDKIVRQSLATRAIPSPKLLTKDHKIMVIPKQDGNPCDKLYRNVLQDWLPWNQDNSRQKKVEILTLIICPIILSKGNT